MKIAGSGAESGAESGSDPDLLVTGTDPHQNVTDPQHCFRPTLISLDNKFNRFRKNNCLKMSLSDLSAKWNPKNLEIKTRSVEKTLEPLVIQVYRNTFTNSTI